MFGKGKDKAANGDRVPASVQQFERLASAESESAATGSISSIGADVTIVGKVSGAGTVKVFGRIEGELHAAIVLIADGAQLDGDIVAEDVTIGGRVKGTVRAHRVRLAGTAVVQGDIFHRSLAIEENARFEGSSRREDAVAEPQRVATSRPQVAVAMHDGGRKLNGAPDGGAHAAAG